MNLDKLIATLTEMRTKEKNGNKTVYFHTDGKKATIGQVMDWRDNIELEANQLESYDPIPKIQ